MRLNETIEICADVLYRSDLDCPPFTEGTFKTLMLIATRGMEFNFNNQMYMHLDRMAIGSILVSVSFNIIFGLHENRILNNTL